MEFLLRLVAQYNVCITFNRSSGSDATRFSTKPTHFAGSQPLARPAETKQAPKPQELAQRRLDKQLTETGERYDVFWGGFVCLFVCFSAASVAVVV